MGVVYVVLLLAYLILPTPKGGGFFKLRMSTSLYVGA